MQGRDSRCADCGALIVAREGETFGLTQVYEDGELVLERYHCPACLSKRGQAKTMTTERLRERISASIGDLVLNWLVYDRKEDEEMPPGTIEHAIWDGRITIDEIVAAFRDELTDGVEPVEE